jgi:hypothetical protein
MTSIILAAGQLSGNVSFSTAQKMINRFLTLDRIKTALDEGRGINQMSNEPEIRVRPFTKAELAEKLGISVKGLEKLKNPAFYEKMASKISLQLSSLYCSTKFAAGEYKGEPGGNHE